MTMTEHWSDKVLEILSADTQDLRKLAEIAGCPVDNFYRGANLRNCDLRGQDLTGIDFTSSNIYEAVIDRTTLIDEVFRPLSSQNSFFKKAEISDTLYDYLDQVRVKTGLPHKSLAMRFLLELVHNKESGNPGIIVEFAKEIYGSGDLVEHFSSKRTSRTNMVFKITRGEHEYALKLGRLFHGISAGYNAAILIGMLIYFGQAPVFNERDRGRKMAQLHFQFVDRQTKIT